MDFELEQEYRGTITPMVLAHFSIPLEAGRGIRAKTCALGDLFPPDDWFIFSIYYPANLNKLFLRDIYIPIVDVANDGVLGDTVIHSFLLHPTTVSRTVLGVRCSSVECHFVFLLLITWWNGIISWSLWLLLGFLWPIFLS